MGRCKTCVAVFTVSLKKTISELELMFLHAKLFALLSLPLRECLQKNLEER